MADDAQIAKALNRVVDVFQQKPEMAKDTDRATAHLDSGLKCIVTQGDHTAIMDMGDVMGGENAGPTPGFFGRAALISCIAIGLKIAAIRSGVVFDAIDVSVEMDWDNRGMFGLGDSPAGPLAMRVEIDIQSKADRDVIQAVIDEGLKNDAWLQVFLDPQDISPVIRINKKVGA
ncbi:MAG: OsmC family protein [Paracoccaceae bacterium]